MRKYIYPPTLLFSLREHTLKNLLHRSCKGNFRNNKIQSTKYLLSSKIKRLFDKTMFSFNGVYNSRRV